MTVLDEPNELLASTGYLLARAGSESRRRFVEALARHDLTLATYSVLMILGAEEGATQRRLATAVGIDPRNLVPILDDLEARGFIVRQADHEDRRRHAVMLSEAGRAQMVKLAKVGERVEKDFLAGLNVRERRQLHRLLNTLLTGYISQK